MHYNRIWLLRGGLDPTCALTQAAFELEGEGLALTSLEARVAPAPSWMRVIGAARDVAEGARAHHDGHAPDAERPRGGHPEVGVVFHLIKERTWHTSRGDVPHGDPAGGQRYRTRYGRWFHEGRGQALALRRALREIPECLLVLRGLDVAGEEPALPLWPTIPLLREVRAESQWPPRSSRSGAPPGTRRRSG